jgi:hypothetical protein
MLRTIIQTREEGTGKELPIPADLLAKVRRAADILETMLRKVGEKFDIEAHWLFEPGVGNELNVWLRLTSGSRGSSCPFPKTALQDDASIRRNLWKPIDFLIPVWSEEVDRMFERIRHNLEALATTAED